MAFASLHKKAALWKNGYCNLGSPISLKVTFPVQICSNVTVGRSTAKKLEGVGITTMEELQETSKEKLCKLLGIKTGTKLREYAFGRDSREVNTGSQKPKSVGVDLTYGVRFTESPAVLEFISKIALEVQNRMKAISVAGQKVRRTELELRAKKEWSGEEGEEGDEG
jgi:nucleotidyltransferase/DNA polymerase involved in DNA repair